MVECEFPMQCAMCNDPNTVIVISATLNICHFFALRTLILYIFKKKQAKLIVLFITLTEL